jgi:hypothetical protein
MTDGIEAQLSASLGAWRTASRRQPRSHATERARDAMLVALSSSAPIKRRPFRMLRPRFAHSGAIAAAATVIAAAGVAAAGWNAPPGSALFVIRATRQSVQLKLPGTNDAALHLQFAEQSLAEARDHINPVQSLADARDELNAAFPELPADRTAALWSRYQADEATLTREVSDLEGDEGSPQPSAGVPGVPSEDTPGRPGSSPSDDIESPSAGRSAGPSPSQWGGDSGGSDDGTPGPTGSGTPRPDN